MAPVLATTLCTHTVASYTTPPSTAMTEAPHPSITTTTVLSSDPAEIDARIAYIKPRSAIISDGALILQPITPSPSSTSATAQPTSQTVVPTASPTANVDNPSNGGGLPAATIGWIVVSVVLGTLLCGLLLWCCCCRGRKSRAELKAKERRRRARRAKTENSQMKEYRSVYMQEPARVYVRT